MGVRPKKESLRVNAKKFMQSRTGTTGCSEQISALLDCLKRHEFDESVGQCMQQYAALTQCTRAAAAERTARGSHAPTINYHLARMAKLMKTR